MAQEPQDRLESQYNAAVSSFVALVTAGAMAAANEALMAESIITDCEDPKTCAEPDCLSYPDGDGTQRPPLGTKAERDDYLFGEVIHAVVDVATDAIIEGAKNIFGVPMPSNDNHELRVRTYVLLHGALTTRIEAAGAIEFTSGHVIVPDPDGEIVGLLTVPKGAGGDAKEPANGS